jgi:hypothetical protein
MTIAGTTSTTYLENFMVVSLGNGGDYASQNVGIYLICNNSNNQWLNESTCATCSSLIIGCLNCSSNTTCTTCNTANNFTSNGSVCACVSGYALNGSVCVSCVSQMTGVSHAAVFQSALPAD